MQEVLTLGKGMNDVNTLYMKFSKNSNKNLFWIKATFLVQVRARKHGFINNRKE